MEVKVGVQVEMPKKIDHKYRSLYDKVCDYIEICKTTSDSEYHFNYLRCLFKKLKCMPCLSEGLQQIGQKLLEYLRTQEDYQGDEYRIEIDSYDIIKFGLDNDEGGDYE